MVTFWRATFVALLSLMLVTSCTLPPKTPFQVNWDNYLQRFFKEGRIVDTGNHNISHTEGQGYAMLFAVEANDETTFTQLWQWTQETLQRPDNLFSWQYTPCPSNDRQCISDPNNASDGEILIAWALLRAADKWSDDSYQQAALLIINAIEQKLLVTYQQDVMILPGEYGFNQNAGEMQVNLSYWIFPALERFYQQTGNSIWTKTIDSGLALMLSARFGASQLNPDWVVLTEEGPTLSNALSADYGYNACRIPLHLAWQYADKTAYVEPWKSFWDQELVPATVNLITGEPADYTYTQGMQAIQKSVSALMFTPEQNASIMPGSVSEQTDYFSASLIMLSHLAWLDNQP